MAPEQIGDAACVDQRADIWSLGVTLYRLITGISPFNGTSFFDTMLSIVQESPPRMGELCPGIPREFDTVVERCLEKRPENRYADVTELAVALAPFARTSSRPAQRGARASIEARVPTI
jgi:eukaryotic-like serine/threonine-protein kinase